MFDESTAYEKQMKKTIEQFMGDGKTISAIVTVANWTMALEGSTYLHFWSPAWQITSDQMWPMKGFHGGSERWQLWANDGNGNKAAIFPGCQIKSLVFCKKCPKVPQIFNFGTGKDGTHA